MIIEIEKDIPIPTNRMRGNFTGLKYTIQTMEIGESFTYPIDRRNAVTGTAHYVRVGMPELRVMTRKINADEIRVWRIA